MPSPTSNVPPADQLTKPGFDALLTRYPALIKSLSDAKPAKPGQKTLQELDTYRYVDAVRQFGQEARPQPKTMHLDHVKTLVEWKLRHGKFRPTLMNLVSSNTPAATTAAIQAGLSAYAVSHKGGSSSNVPGAITALCALRGIGPATASLLLAVHYPDAVLFFSDEAYYWLCAGGMKSSLKYNPKEYEALRAEAAKLIQRLGVSALDVEKVAYVVIKGDDNPVPEKTTTVSKVKMGASKEASSTSNTPKRKKDNTASDPSTLSDVNVRRSKRLKS